MQPICQGAEVKSYFILLLIPFHVACANLAEDYKSMHDQINKLEKERADKIHALVIENHTLNHQQQTTVHAEIQKLIEEKEFKSKDEKKSFEKEIKKKKKYLKEDLRDRDKEYKKKVKRLEKDYKDKIKDLEKDYKKKKKKVKNK
jgi:hypothetical protein